MEEIHGYFYEEMEVGQTAIFSKTVTEADIFGFAGVSGDTNPIHIDEEYASRTMFKGRIAHGMISAGFISTVLGTRLPGPGCVYVSQTLKFKAPVRIGDTVIARATVTAKNDDKKFVTMETVCTIKDKPVVTGEAVLMVPTKED